MSTTGLIRDMLRWIPAGERTGALRDVLASREEAGDHKSVRALAAVLRERESGPVPATTWDGEDGA